jgi:hypothetical protein
VRSDLPYMDRVVKSPLRTVTQKAVRHAINGEDYECDATTEADQYVYSLLDGLQPDALEALSSLMDMDVGVWALYAVNLNGRFPGNGVFYPNASQGKEYKKWLNKLKSFWDAYTDNIKLYSIKGSFLADDTLMVPTVAYLYDMSEADAAVLVNKVQRTLKAFPEIGYDFPLWSFVVTFFVDCPDCDVEKEDVGIGIGDGFAMCLESIGLLGDGPDGVLFHEFGHHVQYANDVEELYDDSPESTRYVELMAHAMAGYYARHVRGGNFTTQRVMDIVDAAYAFGDCEFNSSGHFGTPNQGAKAVRFGAKLAVSSARPSWWQWRKARILPSATFIAMFDAAYPDIVAPDTV